MEPNMQAMLVTKIEISVAVEHCRTVKEACDTVRDTVAVRFSEIIGHEIKPIQLILENFLENWSFDGEMGDKSYVLCYSCRPLSIPSLSNLC